MRACDGRPVPPGVAAVFDGIAADHRLDAFERSAPPVVTAEELAADLVASAEHRHTLAMLGAEDLVRPRVTLVDEQTVRVVNAPPEVHRKAMALKASTGGRDRDPFKPYPTNTRPRSPEQVAAYMGRPNERDVDFRIMPTAAGREFRELVRVIEPSVQVRTFAGGQSDVLAYFE